MTQPTIELLPCPFCGGDGALMRHGFRDYSVACTACDAQTEIAIAAGKAALLWNRRTQSVNTLPLDEVPDGWFVSDLSLWGTRTDAPWWRATLLAIGNKNTPRGEGATPAEALLAAIKKVTP